MNKMSRSELHVELEDVLERPTAEAVKDFLLTNPAFFMQYPQLAEKLRIPHSHKGSVSLVELQGEKLRNRNRLLQQKLRQMMDTAQQNEALYKIYANLNLRLLQCRDMIEVELVLAEVFQEELGLAAAIIKPFSGANALPDIQRTFFREKRFRERPFFFGRLSQHEMQLLFDDQVSGSVAMMLLGERRELGILAIASNNDDHFHPDMDTLLITQLHTFLTHLLPKLEDS